MIRLAMFISKLSIKLLRLFKLGGTSLPGKIARRICPDILGKLAKKYTIICVTGTNGKTTTSRIISSILESTNNQYISNKAGSNLESGIIATLIEYTPLSLKATKKYALLEIDEAAFSKIADKLNPIIILATNFFRDQLDRYGELNSTVSGVKLGISKCPNASIILNADDSLCSSLGKNIDNKVIYYGIEKTAFDFNTSTTISAESSYCMFCKNKYEYDYKTYGHLGGFTCSKCGYKRTVPNISVVKIDDLSEAYPKFSVKYDNNKTIDITSKLPGIYNIYNCLAAFACATTLSFDPNVFAQSFFDFDIGFGRMETINIDGKSLKIILVKNPAGFNQVIDFISMSKVPYPIAIIINDGLADGTDVSWLWDVEFEKLAQSKHMQACFVSGDRNGDIAVRMKYSGIDKSILNICPDYNELIEKGLAKTTENNTFYILPTYTALLDIRKILVKKYKIKNFWK